MEEGGQSERRLQLREVNPYLICVLCGGYFVDAASIVECLHTFCWTCIVKYLEKNKFCPICDVQAYKNKPHLSIRPDYTIQRLAYKIVPGLFSNEMQRRKEFYLSSDPPPTAVHLSPSSFYSPDDNISLSLEYYHAGMNNNEEKCRQAGNDQDCMKMLPHKRYLQCPAAVTINHLKKFVRMKYGLATQQMVDIIYEEECLPENFSLMDVAYTFMWDRVTPMRFSYRILEQAAVPAESKSDINGTHGYSAPKSASKKNNWSQNGPTSSSGGSTTNATSGRQLRGSVFSKRKSDSGNESNDASIKDDETDELDNLSLVKRLRVSARQAKLAEKGSSSPRRRSRSTSRKLRKRRKTVEESETHSDYSTATSPDYPGSSAPTNNDQDSLDDYAKYENDIEEITDEDDEGRLWISPTEDEVVDKESEEATSQDGSVNNDEKKTDDSLDDISSRHSLKVKRKSKKGKHHHHHHHHKHKAPPATILKSSDTDIMKLKVKLNPVISCEKYHKHTSKAKLIGEVIPMTNNSVSATADTSCGIQNNNNEKINSGSNSLSTGEISKNIGKSNIMDKSCENISSSSEISSSTNRLMNDSPISSKSKDEVSCSPFNDDDSQNSLSEGNAEINYAKNVINEDLDGMVEEEKETENSNLKEKKKDLASRQIEVVQTKSSFMEVASKSNHPPLIFTSSDSNSSRSKSPLLHPPSSITVSKITAAEKRKLDEDKRLNNNLDSKSAESLRPSLEIMLVNGPKMLSFFRDDVKKDLQKTKNRNSPVSSTPVSSSTSISISTSSSSSSSTTTSSPLVRLQKMSINLPSMTLTHSSSSQKCYSPKTVVQNGNEPRIQAGSIEISLQKENTAPKRPEETKKSDGPKKLDAGVLDLSTGKMLKPSVSNSISIRPDHSGSPSPKRPKSASPAPIFVKQQVNKVSSPSAMVKSGSGSGTVAIKPGSGSGTKTVPVSMPNSLTLLSNAAAHVESRMVHQTAKMSSSPSRNNLNPPQAARSSPVPPTQKKSYISSVGNVNSSPHQNMSLKIPSLQRPVSSSSAVKSENTMPRPKSESTIPRQKPENAMPRLKPANLPKLNEIDRKQFMRIPQNAGATKPGPNQFVRHITDPSVMIYARQQNAAVVAPISSSSVSSLTKKSPPGIFPIASMLRQGAIPRIDKVTAGLQMKAVVNAEIASVK